MQLVGDYCSENRSHSSLKKIIYKASQKLHLKQSIRAAVRQVVSKRTCEQEGFKSLLSMIECDVLNAETQCKRSRGHPRGGTKGHCVEMPSLVGSVRVTVGTMSSFTGVSGTMKKQEPKYGCLCSGYCLQ